MKVLEAKPNSFIKTTDGIELQFLRMDGVYGKAKNEKGELVYLICTDEIEAISGFSQK